MNTTNSIRTIAAVTTDETSSPLLEVSLLRCPSLKGFPLRPPSLSGITTEKVAWRKFSRMFQKRRTVGATF